MKGDTLLDCVEFQLSPNRTRCELIVSAEGACEKLASGFLKPFLAHLRAAEMQLASGSRLIRLEGYPESTWLTKGTMERFVRFVSTPDVIERVKMIEDELGQLEQVRCALANTFWQSNDGLSDLSVGGIQEEGEGMSAGVRKPFKKADENTSDMSKRELLRAMDVRLAALHQEQNASFTRAKAAGFDNSTMADLMTFAGHFGADRLKEACSQFLALLRKYTTNKGVNNDSNSCTLSNVMPVGSSQTDNNLMNVELSQSCNALPSIKGVQTSENTTVHKHLKLIEKGFSLPSHVSHSMGNQLEVVPMSEDQEKISGEKIESSQAKPSSASEEAPVRRLSVQAAISLFEGKKNDTIGSPVKKLAKQESHKVLPVGGNSPSEKSVLRRWSSMNQPSSGETSSKGKGPASGNKEVGKAEEEEMIDRKKDETSRDCFPTSTVSQVVLQSQNMGYDCSNEKVETFQQYDSNPGKHNDDSMQLCAPQHHVGRNGLATCDEKHVQVLSPEREFKQEAITPSRKEISCSLGMSILAGSKPARESKQDSPIGSYSANMEVGISQGDAISKRPNLETLESPLDTPPSLTVHVKNKAVKQPKHQSASIVSKQEMIAIEKPHSTWYNGSSGADGHPAPKSDPQQVSQSAQLDEVYGAGTEHAAKCDSQLSIPSAEVIEVSGAREVAATKTNCQLFSHVAQVNEASGAVGQPVIMHDSEKISHHQELKLVKKPPALVSPTNMELHMQALMKIVQGQHQDSSSLGRGETVRGRLYDHYSGLREAKLKHESPARKAEREVKLKTLQETFERRKAEMQKGAPRMIKNLNGLTARRCTRKVSYASNQMELHCKDEEGMNDQYESFARLSSASSPASTPMNAVAPPKYRAVKRISQTLKPSTGQQTSVHAGVLISPNSRTRNSPAASSQGKLNAEAIGSTKINNTKILSSARVVSSARVHPTYMQTASDLSPLDEGAVMSSGDMPDTACKEEVKPEPSVAENVVPLMVVGSPSRLQEMLVDASPNAPTSMQEVKPFLRKGRGIGPGAGAGFMKQKALVREASKNSENDIMVDTKVDLETLDLVACKNPGSEMAEDDYRDNVEVIMNGILVSGRGSSGISMMDVPDADADKGNVRHATNTIEDEESSSLPDNASDPTKPDSSPDVVSEEDFQVQIENTKQNGSMSVSLSQLFGQRNVETLHGNDAFTTSSISFREPYKQSVSYHDAHVTSSIVHQGMASAHFSPSTSIVSDSPLESPTLWGSAQASYPTETDLLYSNRQLSGATKHGSLLPPPPKETSKGFKRLLHFGRKNRTSEAAAVDCVSVSTTSEGDDDVEEVGSQPGDDVIRRARMQQKRGYEIGNMRESYSYQDPVQLRGSSIPPPPVNFRPRDDQLHGGSLLKAPRSFFSLSSFRSSKSSEGKSR